jgi:hypothetical protein
MTTPDIAGLCKRLRHIVLTRSFCDTLEPINPDGPEAADTLERQAAAIERLREALEEIKALPDLSKNPANDFDRGARAARLNAADIARAALTGEDAATLGLSGKTQTGGDACTS